jgi:hypothetical protein
MKKNVLNDFLSFTPKLLLILTIFIGGIQNLTAQVQNNGAIYIGEGASFFVKSGSYNFGSGSTTETKRDGSYGKLVFGTDATFSGAASGAGLFVNGFASSRKTGLFELPTGEGTIFAPISVDNASVTNGVDAAYYHTTNTTGLTTPLTAVLNTGNWVVNGDNCKITLSWNTDISSVANAVTDITVAGYNNSTSKWEAITSVPIGSLTSGSVATSSAVVLSNYTAFTLAGKGVSCAPVFAGTGQSITFDGTIWSSTPTDNDTVTITGEGAPGSFICNSLILNADITLTGTQSIEVVNGVTGTRKIIMSSQSSFVQRNPTAAAPAIELTKTTREIKRFDYVYWGSPVSGNVFSQLNNAQVTGYATGAFDSKYRYVSGDVSASGGWQTLTATENGKGFIMRVKEQAPFTTSNARASIDLKFTGTANNGTLTVPVTQVGGTSPRNNNLLANPYPSAIDADKFLTQNQGVIDGVIYLWKANTSNSGSEAYNVADYVAYTKAGSNATIYSGVPTTGFDGKIASGQGFKVRALSNSNVQFNNCMRVATAGSNSQFFRTTNAYAGINDTTKDRFNLSLQTSDGIASQFLVAYLPETTLGYDHMYDAELLSTSATRMYSILDNTTQKLAINARPSFLNTDQVIVGYTKADATPVQMSINLAQTEGVFANNQTPIYLHDTQLNTYHNFANGAYTFSTTAQEDNNRFKIVYQAGQLNNDAFDVSTAFASLINNKLEVNASSDIQNVQVFDLMGRLILNAKPSNIATTVSSDFYQASGVYIVKMELTNGQTISQKLIQK